MKKLLTVVCFLILSLILVTPVAAKNQRPQKIVTLKADETVDSNYFAVGDIVEISGTVNGDVYSAGGQVRVDGTINGDLIVAGGTVSISGNVSQDIRVAGGQISLAGEVGGDVTAVGGNIDVLENTTLSGSLVTAGGNINLDAPVGRDAFAAAGQLTVNTNIPGDLEARVGTLRLTSKANVGGNVNYWSQEEISLDEAAVIGGDLVRQEVTPDFDPLKAQKGFQSFLVGLAIYAKATSVITTLVLGSLLLWLFPAHAQKAAEVVKSKLLKSLGLGFLALVVTPVILVILLMTIVGIPLALTAISLAILYIFVARIYAIVAIGGATLKLARFKKAKLGWTFLLGVIIYYVLTFIPFVGGLIKMLIIFAAVGAALINDAAAYRARR